MTWYMYMYDPYVRVIWECILNDRVHVYVRSVCPCHLGLRVKFSHLYYIITHSNPVETKRDYSRP